MCIIFELNVYKMIGKEKIYFAKAGELRGEKIGVALSAKFNIGKHISVGAFSGEGDSVIKCRGK